jgi:hypothetical protein
MSTPVKEAVIEIAPLPLSIAGTLMNVIGAVYPNARLGSATRGIKILIPEDDEPQELPDDIEARGYDSENDAELLSVDSTGISIATPETISRICLTVMKQSFQNNPDAINYLETRCYDPSTGKSYAMTFQRVEGKSPAELRAEAVLELQQAQAEIKRLKKALKKATSTGSKAKND